VPPDGNAPRKGRRSGRRQVAQVIGPGGTDWLYGLPEAFPDHYPTMEAAMAVAEAALGQPP
jgi:hypothetical protein